MTTFSDRHAVEIRKKLHESDNNTHKENFVLLVSMENSK